LSKRERTSGSVGRGSMDDAGALGDLLLDDEGRGL
jgi:hypothetical protein